MRSILLPCGEPVPCFGMGTWNMGDKPALRKEELTTLRLGLERGARLIDTAEMYGDGRAEELVAEAIAGRRDEAFLVTKVYPHNASRDKMRLACERSLRRLKTDRIDLYLLHWRGSVPLHETVEAFEALVHGGKIRRWGVSNLDVEDMDELFACPGARGCQTDQVLYNLVRRQPEAALLPWLGKQSMPLMAYSPVEQARLLRNPALLKLSRQLGIAPVQTALAWLLRRHDVIVIPKAARREHLEENLKSLEVALTGKQLAMLDLAFAPPAGPAPIEML
jgi:diketogulonate reductase-like aldo/keto reductase